jgi:Ankyrin repeats (3 copies)
VNVYYRNIISTHPSVPLSESGDDEAIDEVAQRMIDSAKLGDVRLLTFLVGQVQKASVGTCVGERLGSLMLHLAAEAGHAEMVRYLVTELWVDCDACTIRAMTAAHYAAKANRVKVIRELAAAGADLLAQNDSGQIPVQMTQDRIVRRLFDQFGASAGRRLRDFAASARSQRVVDYMCLMTVAMAPQLSDDTSDVSSGSVHIIGQQGVPHITEMFRCPDEVRQLKLSLVELAGITVLLVVQIRLLLCQHTHSACELL